MGSTGSVGAVHCQSSAARMGFFKIAAFFALVAAICFAVDKMALAGLRRVKTCGFGVSNKLFEGRINADVVISGSSRALVHYDPRVIQAVVGCSAFNIGLNGSQTDMQVAVLSAYLKHNKKPSVVLHNLDSFSFVATREVFDPAQFKGRPAQWFTPRDWGSQS